MNTMNDQKMMGKAGISQDLRQQMIAKLIQFHRQEAVMTKSPQETEEHLYKISPDCESYIGFFGKVFKHLTERANKLAAEQGRTMGNRVQQNTSTFSQRQPVPGQRMPTAQTMSSSNLQSSLQAPLNPQFSSRVPAPAMLASPVNQTTPSPSNMNIHTPGQPDDQNDENAMYIEKLRQLQKYVPILETMLKQQNEEGARQHDGGKLERLLQILRDQHRIPYKDLVKCENVMERLVQQQQQQALSVASDQSKMPLSVSPATSSQPPSQPPASLPLPEPTPAQLTAMPRLEDPMCQSLYRTIVAHINNPMLGQALKTTFGPPMDALNRTEVRRQNSQRSSGSNEETTDFISDLVQGELARLPRRYRVSPVNRTCLRASFNGEDIPDWWILHIKLSEKYPEQSPSCSLALPANELEDGCSSLNACWSTFQRRLVSLPDPYTIHELLQTWESSVRDAIMCPVG